MHSPRGQDVEDRVFLQKVVNQYPANFVVIALLFLGINLAFWLVKLSHQRQSGLVNVVWDSVLEERLIQVEFFWSEGGVAGGVFSKYTAYNKFRLRTFLNVRKYLVHLVWNDVSVLVLSYVGLEPFLFLKRLVFLFSELFGFFNSYRFRYFITTFFAPLIRGQASLVIFLLSEGFRVLNGNLLWLKCSGGFFRL